MNNYNIDIYNECLNETYQDDRIKPIINCLYRVVKHYDRSLSRHNGRNETESKYIINRNKSDFINKVFPVFLNIVDKCDYIDLDRVLDFLFHDNCHWYCFANHLKLFYLKDELYKDNINSYYSMIKSLCSCIVFSEVNNKIENYLYQLLKYYKKYYNHIYTDRTDLRINGFLGRYGHLIVGIVYKDYNLEDLDIILNKVINNFDEIDNYFKLNGLDNNITDLDYEIKKELIINMINNNKVKRKTIL